MRSRADLDRPDLFWARVDRTAGADGCWPWTGALSSGYGYLQFGERILQAHRAAVLLDGREIPDRMEVDHLCRNRACQNPRHLDVVTREENLRRERDAVAAERAAGLRPRPSGFDLVDGVERCTRGHEITASNLLVEGSHRRCRECRTNQRQRRTLRELESV